MSLKKSKEEYLETKRRDKLKNLWAKKNNYELIRIKYDADYLKILSNKILS